MSVPSSVYGELIGAGGLSGVESKPVRVELANFHYQLGWVQKQIDYFRSNRVDAIAESDPRMTVKVDFGKEEAESQDYDRDALCADRAFRNRVASATRNHDVFASYFTDMTDYAIAMCAVLGKSIGKACIPEKAIGGPLKGKDAAVAEKALADWKGEF